VVAESNFTGEDTETVVASPTGRFTSTSPERADQRFEGPPSQNEDNVGRLSTG